jgi:hypothetical protein
MWKYKIPYCNKYCEWCMSCICDKKDVVKKGTNTFCCDQCLENYLFTHNLFNFNRGKEKM